MRLNNFFTAGLILTLNIYILCWLKYKITFFTVRSLPGLPYGVLEMCLIIHYPFGILAHLYHPPALLLGPTPTAFCGFYHALATVSGRYVTDNSAHDISLIFYSRSVMPCNDLDFPSFDKEEVQSEFHVHWYVFIKWMQLVWYVLL